MTKNLFINLLPGACKARLFYISDIYLYVTARVTVCHFHPMANVIKLSGAPLWGGFLAFSVSIRIGWKGFPGIKTLAYYGRLKIKDFKSFITMGLGPPFVHKWSHIMDFNLALKHYPWLKVTDSDKRTSLLHRSLNYWWKKSFFCASCKLL